MNEPPPICPNCRQPLPPDVPLGLCPACLVKSGLDTGPEPGAAGPESALPSREEIAQRFPQLEILGLIGRGGMGAVFKARQPALDRLVALKILLPHAGTDPGFAERFNREARALARLNHSNIVAVHDFGQADGWYYLVMEFVDGANLRALERHGRIPPGQALRIVPQICDALQFAHDEGIVHRDIKPENILLDTKGRVKITDFGIAKIIGTTPDKVRLTGAQDILGTPHYMAPEQIEHPDQVDHRADIYSLGVVFYELLTGELPLGKFPPPSSKAPVDARFDPVVLRTLEKEPARRYQRASEVKTATEVIAGQPPLLPPPPPIQIPPRREPPRKTNRGPGKYLVIVVAACLALLVVVSAGMTLIWLWAHEKSAVEKQSAQMAGKASPHPPLRPPLQLAPKELSATKLREALIDLQSADSGRKQLATTMLAGAKPAEARDEVAGALIPALADASWAVRQNAARALGVWGTTNAYQPLIKTLDDPQFSVRWAAIDALVQWKDAATASALAGHMASGADVLRTGQALRAIGAPGEDAVDELLQAKDPQARYEACRILRDIGTRKSIPALTTAAGDADGIASMLAKDALRSIDTR